MTNTRQLAEKEPLLHRKNSAAKLKLLTDHDSSSSLELEPESENPIALHALTTMAHAIANLLAEHEETLSEEFIQAFSLLSITCKTMQAKLRLTERTSPLYYIEPKILLEKINILLNIKLNDNEKTLTIKTYLEKHITELKKPHWFGLNLETSPPAEHGLWDHKTIKDVIAMLLLTLPLIGLVALDVMNKLPLTEELYHYLSHARTAHDTGASSDASKGGARLFTWIILYVLYALPSMAALFALIPQALRLLDVIWLNNAEHDLTKITHYPEKNLAEAVNQSQSLNETIDKEGAATTPETKYKTLTLFNQVSALKKIPAAPEKVDIEAQEEPQLRVHNP